MEAIYVIAKNLLQFVRRDGNTAERKCVGIFRINFWTPEMCPQGQQTVEAEMIIWLKQQAKEQKYK